ncbi:bacteriophage Gp15 family protein [Streptococcus pyogenes]|uniref:bacteriophage Gp15 family protein n=1 Tax=Streptococcus pyogenes TaxID=1314 RepID=UPI002DDC1721|nr:bacteriophage Gp15 family protein [Streptococcus pyogenes]WSE60824.1 bacteriophage Gp15 family protein [Streptococcus pyogenes]
MKLNDPLVESFEFRGETYPINLSFNCVLDVFDVIDDDFLNEAEKCFLCLDILLDRTDLPFTYAVDLWVYIKTNFIDAERSEKPQLDIKGNPMPVVKEKEDNKKVIDFRLDAEFIYASFMQAYQINLLKEQNKLSWIEFKALLNALPEDTIMQRIIAIRQWKDDGKGDKEYRDNMRKLKAKYSLDDGEEEDDGS